MLRQEDARPALRTILSFARNAIPIDLVELPLEAGVAFRLLCLGHHLPPFFFGSAFFSTFFSSFFSAGFFSSFGAGFFSSFAGAFSTLGSAFGSGLGGSGFGAAAGFSALGAGAGFSGFGAASFFTSGSMSLLRIRMCFRSTARASSFVLYTFAYPTVSYRPNVEACESITTMSLVAFNSFARNARRASRVGVGSALWIALNETSVRLSSGFSLRWITSSCMRYRSIRRRTSKTRAFAASSARTTTTPWDGRPYSTAADRGARAMQTRARRSSSPRTSTRTRSFDLKASDATRHASGMIVPAGFVTRITTDPIRCRASRSSGSSWRFVLKSTRQMSGDRPRATRSSVQKSPTVTTGLARPIAGRMPSPCTSEPIGQRRYSRNESGRRNVASANSANAKGELPIDMDAHLLGDLGPRVVHDDHVPLPILRCLVPAQRALVLVRDRGTVLARLWNLDDHTSPFLPGAAFRSRAVLFDPVEFAEGGLAHRESDFRLPRRPFVQGDRDDPRPDLVADPQVALCVLPDEPLPLFVHVDPIVHDLRDVQEAVQGTESHESAELKDFHDRALDDLLQGRRVHEGVALHALVHRAVAVDDAALAHPFDVACDQGDGLVRPDLAFQGGAGKLAGHGIDVLPQAFGRVADDVLPLDPLVHENRRGSYWVHLFFHLGPAAPGSRFFLEILRCTRE